MLTFDNVLNQMSHLSYKNWDCGCKRTKASAIMTKNYHLWQDLDELTFPIRRRRIK